MAHNIFRPCMTDEHGACVGARLGRNSDLMGEYDAPVKCQCKCHALRPPEAESVQRALLVEAAPEMPKPRPAAPFTLEMQSQPRAGKQGRLF